MVDKCSYFHIVRWRKELFFFFFILSNVAKPWLRSKDKLSMEKVSWKHKIDKREEEMCAYARWTSPEYKWPSPGNSEKKQSKDLLCWTMFLCSVLWNYMTSEEITFFLKWRIKHTRHNLCCIYPMQYSLTMQFCLLVNPMLLEHRPQKNGAHRVTANMSLFCLRSKIETISHVFTIMAEFV